MKTFIQYVKHQLCQGILFCKPPETVVKCTLTSYRISIDYLLIFCILQFCDTAHQFLNSCCKFMHMFWKCGHILQIQTAYVSALWFCLQNNWSTELGVYMQYSCNILVMCGRDDNLVWKSLQRKILSFSTGCTWMATYILSQRSGVSHISELRQITQCEYGTVRPTEYGGVFLRCKSTKHWKWNLPTTPPKKNS
jgi:hypothetical protein